MIRHIVALRFRAGMPSLPLGAQQQPTDGLGTGRAARLTGDDTRLADFLQSLGQQTGLGAFSGTLAAFKGNKLSAFHGISPSRPFAILSNGPARVTRCLVASGMSCAG